MCISYLAESSAEYPGSLLSLLRSLPVVSASSASRCWEERLPPLFPLLLLAFCCCAAATSELDRMTRLLRDLDTGLQKMDNVIERVKFNRSFHLGKKIRVFCVL